MVSKILPTKNGFSGRFFRVETYKLQTIKINGHTAIATSRQKIVALIRRRFPHHDGVTCFQAIRYLSPEPLCSLRPPDQHQAAPERFGPPEPLRHLRKEKRGVGDFNTARKIENPELHRVAMRPDAAATVSRNPPPPPPQP